MSVPLPRIHIGALHGGTGSWEIAYGLEEERFFQRTLESPAGPHIIPMWKLATAARCVANR
ncbi:hypothetical protein [Streptomyces sp. AM6-12]|uniref:hypothetical protein n=1 Tax=Streptomyces sp. AM6-12 TaxID=3345149 RepID=UPI0037A98F2E